jgi:hypothetical protein
MKRRSFVGWLGVGTLSGVGLVNRAFAGTVDPGKQDKPKPASELSPDLKASNERHFQVLPGQRILLNGDSISKGYAFGNYTDPSPLRTLYGMAEILMKDNMERPPEWVYLPGVWEGINPDGTPKTVDTLAGEIQTYIRRGDFRTGDWMIYEDAGGLNDFVHPAPWPSAKDMYNSYRRALRGMFLQAKTCTGLDQIRCMTMFDYDPKYGWCKWDLPLDDGVHTGNDAIRDEANAMGVPWIDMNRIMDRAHDYVTSRGWGRMVGPDGIHPNVFGNFVMTLAILDSMGADIASWKIDGLIPHFRHPEAGGDVKTIWGWTKNPTDDERIVILKDLQEIVAREVVVPAHAQTGRAKVSDGGAGATAHTFRRLRHHGRLISHPATQPVGTTKPVSYELGTLFQLDAEHLLLVASMREQGGHDFEVGNDGFIFKDLSEIAAERAIPLNRLEPNYQFKSGKGSGVLAKFPGSGAFVPLGAKLENGDPHPGAGTGFLLTTCQAFLADRSEAAPDADEFVQFQQLKWANGKLEVTNSELPSPLREKAKNQGFNCVPLGSAFLCPCVAVDGTVVIKFEFVEGQWKATYTSKPFLQNKFEIEPSIRKTEEGFLVYTRGSGDRRGRIYRSIEGLEYYFVSDHWNYTVPQVMNQGLDGSIYLTTNTGPGWLRNPLLAYALQGLKFVDPVSIHDEKEIGDDKEKEVPFCDHGVGNNVFLNGRWRHLLLYRVCDLRETNGEGAPPMPQTGLYMAELEYDSATHVPFRF